MIKPIDKLLNQITMYRLILYFLIILLFITIILSFFQFIPFNPFSILFSSLFLAFFSRASNYFFSKIFKATTNIESAYITGLILSLIVLPANSIQDFMFLIIVATLAQASKYILAIGRKHIFNPAAIAVVLTAFFLKQSAIWWVGSMWLMPFVFFGGILIVRKIQREHMVYSFLFITLLITSILGIINHDNLITTYRIIFFNSSLFFFAFVMLTEPLTTPPRRNLQIIYGLITGILYTPQIHFFGIYITPETALVITNIFSYLVGPKLHLVLNLKEKTQTSPDTYDFIFQKEKSFNFLPGQYLEWTLTHKNADNRGNRRYFTIASSPTENSIRIGVKFYERSSSFKKALLNIDSKTQLTASQLTGDFVLPEKNDNKYVFITGGIGITPYRSIIKYLIDRKEKKDIILFYSNKLASEIIYQDIFETANKTLGIMTFYTLTDTVNIPKDWQGEVGRINEKMIKQKVPDYLERIFYLSGPHFMVTSFEDVLRKMGVSREKIKTDFFPGYV